MTARGPTAALHGSLTPELDGSEVALLYDQLAVYDTSGRTLPAYMRLAGCAPGRPTVNCTLQLVIDDAGAAYPLTMGVPIVLLLVIGLIKASMNRFKVQETVTADG